MVSLIWIRTITSAAPSQLTLYSVFISFIHRLLNTLLFTLAGVEYGAIISDNKATEGVTDALFSA